MQVINRFFPEILPDNEANYFQGLIGVVESVDELASMEIIRSPVSYNFRIIPSVPRYINMIIEEILKFHNLLGVHLDISKSIKNTGVITFKIKL